MIRGQHPIVAMRLRGRRPDSVWITAGVDKLRQWRDWTYWSPQQAAIEVSEDEPASGFAPAFRCLVGLMVFVSGDNAERVDAVSEAVRNAGARCCHAFTYMGLDCISARYFTEGSPQWQPF